MNKFRDPLDTGYPPDPPSGVLQASTLRALFGHGFVRCYDLLHDEDIVGYAAITPDLVHTLRTRFYSVALAALRLLRSPHAPDAGIVEVEPVRDYEDGNLIDVVGTEVGIGSEESVDYFEVRWRLTEVDRDGGFKLSFQVGPDWTDDIPYEFWASGAVFREIGDNTGCTVEQVASAYLEEASKPYLIEQLKPIRDWAQREHRDNATTILAAFIGALAGGNEAHLARVCEGLAGLNGLIAGEIVDTMIG